MLALGIAATTAVYTLIKGVLLTPPPYEQPENLVLVTGARADDRDAAAIFGWPQQLWDEWLAGSQSFESMAGYRWVFNFLISNDGSEPLEGMLVSEGYFSVVGVQPELGRSFLDSDSDGTEAPAIIIGHDLWVRRFDSDPDIIGQTIQLSGQPPATVVGAMPPGVRFLPSPAVASEPNYDLHAKVDYWLPIPRQMRDRPAWNVVARLNPGVATSEAEAEVAVLLARQAQTVPEIEGLGARIDPLMSILNADGERLLLPLLAAAGHQREPTVAIDNVKTLDEIRGESLASRNFAMQLLIGFAVIACLLTLGGIYSVLSLSVTARRREIAIRSAIGAERGRILNLVMRQGLAMTVSGALIGIIVSIALARGLQSWLFGVDATDPGTVLGATAIFIVVASIACWAPARRAATIEPVEALRAE